MYLPNLREKKKQHSNIVTFCTSFNLQPMSFILSLTVRYPKNAEI